MKEVISKQEEFVINSDTIVEYKGNSNVLIIPDGVKVIGKCAFFNQWNLRKVTMPNSVEIIEELAFV